MGTTDVSGLTQLGKEVEQPKSPEAERPVDEEMVSNCCTAPFGYPGWPDNDICSQCGEHADIAINEDLFEDKQGDNNE